MPPEPAGLMLIGVPVGGFEGRGVFPPIDGIAPGLPGRVIFPPLRPRFELVAPLLVAKGSELDAAPTELGEPGGFRGALVRGADELFGFLVC